MKNYLVKSLFEVQDPNWIIKNRNNEPSLYQDYLNMHLMSVDSYKKYLEGDWELKFIGGKVPSIQHAFKKTWDFIYDLWKSEPCNILYTDPDTLAISNFSIWNKFHHFMMFNFTDPKSLNTENVKIPYFFNAGVRYFPHTMSEEIWRIGNELKMTWDDKIYDTEQIILNKMLWSQNLKLEQALFPNLAYQAHLLPSAPLWQQDLWNGLNINESLILHFHGSRNSSMKLNLMRQIYETKRIGIS